MLRRRTFGFSAVALISAACQSGDAEPLDEVYQAQPGGPETCVLLPEPVAASQATFDALSSGVLPPSHVGDNLGLPDRADSTAGTVGTLALGLHPHLVPIINHPRGALVAASTLGAGRVVAFSSQDFLSSSTRSTLVNDPKIARLLANAATWAGNAARGRVLVDNDALRSALQGAGVEAVDVVASRGDLRDWSSDLSRYAVVAIQINEWGTLRLSDADIAHIRAFVRAGGGLLVAGSAVHWDWWIGRDNARFPGNVLLEGSGISWDAETLYDTSRATMGFDGQRQPLALWHDYSRGAPIAADKYAMLPHLLSSAVTEGLDIDPALERLVRETPALPVSSTEPAAVLAAEVIQTLPPYSWPSEHPWARVFPGSVPESAARVTSRKVPVDRRWVGPVPLGLYAPPGEVITVRVPAGVESLGLTIQVGELHDPLTAISDVHTWRRAPVTVRTFNLDATQIDVGSPLGGTLYAVLPESPVSTGSIDVEVTGAVLQPVYIDGQTRDWAAVRQYPAPQAILEAPGKVRLAVASSAIRGEDGPAAIMAYWKGFFDSHFELSQEPVARRRASHMIFDPQVGWGWANASDERINHPKVAEEWALRRDLGREDIWLFGHEMGHQFQTGNWSGGDITEVCVNLFTMYTLNGYRNGGGDKETRGYKDNRIDHVALKSYRWPTADVMEKLEMYRELVFEFGWNKYKEVFASYYSPAYSDATDGTYLDGFAIRFSRVVRRDLTAFFDNWQYPLSPAARARIASFRYPRWLPPGW